MDRIPASERTRERTHVSAPDEACRDRAPGLSFQKRKRNPAVGSMLLRWFWQFMTCVSQLTRQAVFVCDDINGVGVSGTVWTSPGVLPFVRRRRRCRQGAIPEALRQASVRRS